MRRSVVVVGIAIAAHPLWAATYTVTSPNDSGAGSLRQAILDAEAHAGADTITFATAISTAGGAGVAFSLSAPAEVTVTVLNLAGRPIAVVVQGRPTQAGLQRVVWNGQTLNGTKAPNGQYLVRVAAHGADGGQSSVAAALSLGR